MKNWLKDNFEFSKREMNGLLFLLVLIVLAILSPYFFEYFWYKPPISTSFDRAAIQKLELIDRYEKKKFNNLSEEKEFGKKAKYKVFNPNLISENEWQEFGLSNKQAKSIVNYVKKGGKFYKPEDLKKMFVISPKKYQELLPYVDIPALDNPAKTYTPYQKKALVIVEINSADTLKLDEIKGIGPSFARRIAKYRDRLGGFYQKEQLMEVFGLDSTKFNEIKEFVSIDLGSIKKININRAEFEDLKNHPYLKYKEMNAIIQYRKQHGNYRSAEDLRKIIILPPQTIERIAPYLSFE